MRVTLFMSISINGIIARPDGRGDFFTDACWHGFVDIVRDKGALIWGRRTHDIGRGWASFKRDLVRQQVRGVVLTRDANYALEPGWEVATSPRTALEQLQAHGLEETLVAGGPTVNTAFAREGLIDNVTVFVESVIIGQGLPLLQPGQFDLPCRLLEITRPAESVVRLDYAVAN